MKREEMCNGIVGYLEDKEGQMITPEIISDVYDRLKDTIDFIEKEVQEIKKLLDDTRSIDDLSNIVDCRDALSDLEIKLY